MRVGNLLIAAIVLSPATFAQNEIEIWPGVTNFTSRGSIGNNATGGDVLQGLHTTSFTGIGDNGVLARVDGFGMMLQDQNTTTQESYLIVYRGGTDSAGPDSGNAGVICSLGPYTSPPRGTGGQIQAWNISQSFPTAHCMELCDFNAFGVSLSEPPNPWTGDGLSCHISRGEGDFGLSVQRATSSRPDMAWQIINDVVTHPSLMRSWRFRIITDTGTLQMGNGTTRYGQGGMNPATGEPLTARARYGATGVDDSWLFLTAKKFCPGISVEPGMRVYLDPNNLVGPIIIAGIPSSGEVIHELGNTPMIPLGMTVHFQAVGINKTLSKCTITNLCSTEL